MNKKSVSNYQDLIKFLAIILMFADHIGYYFSNDLLMLRVMGRPVMAIFCFFAGYNYKLMPNFNIIALGFLMLLESYSIRCSSVIDNILVIIFFGQCYISLFHAQLKNFYSSYIHFIILGFLAPFIWDYAWYSTYVIAIMVLGYQAKYNKSNYKLSWFLALLMSFLYTISIFDFLNHAVFNFDFTNIYLITLLVLNIALYYIIIFKEPELIINVNLNFISRNALYIYFFSVIIMEYIWLYLIITKY